ncbi:hypothetical protein [Sphingobium fuliginis]|uniref:hypothetical protein n=1 Tax=Sphingobium fuliginis (strain ATCC 27551) TaxID=336203 RepID=UPI0037C8F8C5
MTDKAPVTVEQGMFGPLKPFPGLADEDKLADWIGHVRTRAFVSGARHNEIDRAEARHWVQSIAALEEEIKRLREALTDHNEALRSAYQVADREGKDTNWLALRGNIMWALAEHQQIVNNARTALEGRGS